MSTETLTLTLPSSPVEELGSATEEFLAELLERGLREMRIDRVLERYTRGGMSFDTAVHEARIAQSELARQAYARGTEPPFCPNTLDEELS
jgi:hypothetical protein